MQLMNFWITSGDGVPPLLAATSLRIDSSDNNAVKQALSTFSPFASNWAIIKSIVASGTVPPTSDEGSVSPGATVSTGTAVSLGTVVDELDLLSPQADKRPNVATDASAVATRRFM